MQSPPVVVYTAREQIERCRPPDGLTFRVISAMLDTGKFYRNKRNSIVFLSDPPDGFIGVARSAELAGLLLHSGAIEWRGDPIADYPDELKALSYAINDFRWKLPRIPRRYNEIEPSRYAGTVPEEPARLPSAQRRETLRLPEPKARP
jgi:hypothetical protein